MYFINAPENFDWFDDKEKAEKFVGMLVNDGVSSEDIQVIEGNFVKFYTKVEAVIK